MEGAPTLLWAQPNQPQELLSQRQKENLRGALQSYVPTMAPKPLLTPVAAPMLLIWVLQGSIRAVSASLLDGYLSLTHPDPDPSVCAGVSWAAVSLSSETPPVRWRADVSLPYLCVNWPPGCVAMGLEGLKQVLGFGMLCVTLKHALIITQPPGFTLNQPWLRSTTSMVQEGERLCGAEEYIEWWASLSNDPSALLIRVFCSLTRLWNMFFLPL